MRYTSTYRNPTFGSKYDSVGTEVAAQVPVWVGGFGSSAEEGPLGGGAGGFGVGTVGELMGGHEREYEGGVGPTRGH